MISFTAGSSLPRRAEERPAQAELSQATSPELAFQMSAVMQSVIEEGTAVGARGKLRRPAAGKTGTTNDGADTWFVGYTPELVASVWVGFDQPRPIVPQATGGHVAAPIAMDIYRAYFKSAAASGNGPVTTSTAP